MFKHRLIGGKNVYTVEAHHEALEAWAVERLGAGHALNLISVDQHTDTLKPFTSYVGEELGKDWYDESEEALRENLVGQIDFEDQASVWKAVERLRHDEHIHTATASDIIDIAYVFSIQGTQTASQEEKEAMARFKLGRECPSLPERPHKYELPENKILVIPFDCHPDCTSTDHNASCYRKLSDQVIESKVLGPLLEIGSEMSNSIRKLSMTEAPYILDIDLDTFHTHLSLRPEAPDIFHTLIRDAVAVTIAVERDCTEGQWLDDSEAPVDEMLLVLYGHIESAAVGKN